MKSLILFFLGISAILSAFYLINPTELQLSSFNQVFAQSEDKNKNFDDAITIHSSETITNEKTRIYNIQEKNFDDTIIIHSSNTTSKDKSEEDNGENRNFEEAILSQSSDTSTIANQNYETSFIGRLAPSEFPKIHPAITQILEHANPKAMAKIYDVSIENDRLYVYVHFAENQIQNKPSNIEILAQDKNIIVSKLTLNQIKSLSDLDSVERITLPDYAVFDTHIVSEGVSFSLADEMHLLGFDGTGINVAVIDDSFNTTNSEISGNLGIEWFAPGCGDIACGSTNGKSHGTAVAEIVRDMAPNATLWLYAIQTSVDFANAVDNATANNVDIITASLGFPTQGGNDNSTGWYRDGTSAVAQKVNEAKTNGTLITIAAGNQGENHWSGFYNFNTPIPIANLTDPLFTQLGNIGYESVLNFNASASGNMRACLPVNNVSNPFTPYLVTWNEWPLTSDEDYAVWLYSRDMTDEWNSADIFQYNGTSRPDEEGEKPLESVLHVADTGDACLVIPSFFSSEDQFFHIDLGNNGLDSSFQVPSGSIDTPADATGVLAVGAVTFSNTVLEYSDDALEVFSSQGPTDDGRLKPEICGPDGTLTSQTVLTGGGGFFGTSASTPHVAGAAALMLEQSPTLTADQLRQKLIDNARFDADFSQENLCGSDSGSLSLFDPPPCQNVPSSGPWTVDESCTLTTNSSMSSLIVQNNSSLKLDSGVTLDLDSANSLSIKPSSSLLIKSGASLTFTGLPTQLTIIKVTTNDNGGTASLDDFMLTVDGNSVLSGVKNTYDENTLLTIDETQLTGYTFDSISGDIKCPGILGGNITLADGDDITCTITNDDVAPSLTLVKQITNDHNGTAVVSNFELTATGTTGFSGNGTASSDSNFQAGTYDLSESGPAGYTASSWVCTGTGTQVDGDTITLSVGESATCTITNDDVAPSCVLPESGDWIVSSDCIMSASDIAPGNVTVENNAVLTIPSGVTLDIDHANFDLIIKSGGSVLVKLGGELT